MYYKNCLNLFKALVLVDGRISEEIKSKIRLQKETLHVNNDTALLKKELETLPGDLKKEFEEKWILVEKHIGNAMGVS